MNDKQIFMLGIIVNAFVTGLGMFSENLQRQHLGQSMAYTDDDFQKILDKNALMKQCPNCSAEFVGFPCPYGCVNGWIKT